jgi:hypothetical protein
VESVRGEWRGRSRVERGKESGWKGVRKKIIVSGRKRGRKEEVEKSNRKTERPKRRERGGMKGTEDKVTIM